MYSTEFAYSVPAGGTSIDFFVAHLCLLCKNTWFSFVNRDIDKQ